ncbi:hypothetical protein IFM89_000385 [Coptis chinensis]|uniref:Uncharacterized protein n=1 Tax=Coptis chinensis TaxID=261450 RepID=A0A835HBW6_9MAGN|nr:hypothetical protein IFM89_000385 [Coptis chinensis]
MATAGETSYQGGVGGKFRKNEQNRNKSSTPYDRNTNRNRKKGLISSVLDTSSRIITSSARKFFSSVYPPSPTVENHESRDAFAGSSFGDQERIGNEKIELSNASDIGSVNDLEQIFKQKIFTRQVLLG